MAINFPDTPTDLDIYTDLTTGKKWQYIDGQQSWIAVSQTDPGGSDTQLLYNNGGSAADGVVSLRYDQSTDTINANGIVVFSNNTIKPTVNDGGPAGGNQYSVGYLISPIEYKTTNYTAKANDSGKLIVFESSGTLYIDADDTLNLTLGTTIGVFNNTTSTISISPGVGTPLFKLVDDTLTGARTLSANGVASMTKIATNTWILSGATLT